MAALAGLVVAAVLSYTLGQHQRTLPLVVWLVLLLRLIWKAFVWAVDYFVVTSQRMILTSGLIAGRWP